MNLQRLLNTELGRIFISILLGLGLATFFRKACKDKDCIVFNGPIISDIEGKTYKHGEKCYQYTTQSDKCDSTKKVVDITTPPEDTTNPSGLPLPINTTTPGTTNTGFSFFK
jgi:hypothetical protein